MIRCADLLFDELAKREMRDETVSTRELCYDAYILGYKDCMEADREFAKDFLDKLQPAKIVYEKEEPSKSGGLIVDDLIPEKRPDRLNDTELRTLFRKAFDCGYNAFCARLEDEEEIRDNGLIAFFRMYEDFLNAHEKGYELNGYMSVEVEDKECGKETE